MAGSDALARRRKSTGTKVLAPFFERRVSAGRCCDRNDVRHDSCFAHKIGEAITVTTFS
ncbi:MAG: hypothetical protein AAFV90_10320 [Cyanobacteria bacterium J06634_5]